MPIKLSCSLCLAPSSEYEPLQSEKQEFNNIYEITIKYFDPMLLKTVEKADKYLEERKVLCKDCWMHIKDFSEFQRNVIRTRSRLEKTVVNLFTVVKVENDELEEANSNHKNTDENYDKDDMELDHGKEFECSHENVYIKYELDIEADSNEQQSPSHESEDDEDPLISTKIIKKNRKSKQIRSEAIDEPTTVDTEQSCTKNKKVELVDESDLFIAEWKPVLDCDLCDETYSNCRNLRNHFREKHKTRFYIKCCERKFYRRHILVNHIQLHLNPETHKCDICGKISTCKNNLNIHKKVMHEEGEKLECEICHKLFNKKPYLERHLLTHVTGEKNFICQECGKGYVLEVQLKSHIKSVHNVDRVCDQCGKTIHGAQAMKKHLMEHAGVEKIKFPCDVCGAELHSRSSLKRHKNTLHHDGSTVYVCSICGKTASNANALVNHKRLVHDKERKFKCTYCDKAFKTPKSLREHVATHTGQALYQCPHCPQTFKVNANMHHHRKRVHPVEWEESRKNRLQTPKLNINHIEKQIVL